MITRKNIKLERATKKVKNDAEMRQVVLITGASAGIGAAIAERFAAAGHDLVLVARSGGKLQTLAAEMTAKHGVFADWESADLAESGAAEKLAESLQAKHLQVKILVNNAGVLEQGAFVDIAWEKQLAMLQLNIVGLTAMLKTFLPLMQAQGGGRILNVASIAAFQPVVSLATYAASKAYVLSLSEALAEECAGTGVTVSTLCPGITATGMVSGAMENNPVLSNIPSAVVGTAEQVAQQAYAACMRGDAICVPGVLNLATTLAARAAPKWLVRRVSGLLGRTAM